jgi:hypothetical protein
MSSLLLILQACLLTEYVSSDAVLFGLLLACSQSFELVSIHCHQAMLLSKYDLILHDSCTCMCTFPYSMST